MKEAILVVSFGGPETNEDVIPFLENVLRGKNVPRERMLEVADHYYHFGGKSPINEQNRALIAALERRLHAEGPALPVYFGNRNWRPLLPDAFREMKAAGIERVYAFVTSACSNYSGCRQYRENMAEARVAAQATDIEVFKLRVYFNHPGFIEPMIDNTQAALAEAPGARLVFTAHSIPVSMAKGCNYETQLREASRLIAEGCGHTEWDLVWQSRSGPPGQPWLEPDVNEHLKDLAARGVKAVVVVPVGFVSDHLEVIWDLDHQARETAEQLGMAFARAATVGTDARFVGMIRSLVRERREGAAREALGLMPPNHDVCPVGCCPPPMRPAAAGRPPA
jgi:ferrochelatase